MASSYIVWISLVIYVCSFPCAQQSQLPPVSRQCPYWSKDKKCALPNPSQCESSDNCRKGDTCCLYECGGAQCLGDLCPGFEPRTLCKTANPRSCNVSSDCGGGNFCCEFECGGTRCFDRVVKEGECPPTSPRSKCAQLGSTFDGCYGDGSCPAMQKCCETDCAGRECRDPVKKGLCPALIEQCSNTMFEEKTEGSLCKTDLECDGDLKCCTVKCSGQRECLTPVKEKDGVCPTVRVRSEQDIDDSPCIHNCNSDVECPQEEKCCFNGCDMSCISVTI